MRLCGCLVAAACRPATEPNPPSISTLAADLAALGPPAAPEAHDTFRAMLETTLGSDSYECAPPVRHTFFGPVPHGVRAIRGRMQHYGVFDGPVRYAVARDAEGWRVTLEVRVHAQDAGGELELADCGEPASLPGGTCAGTPYAASGTTEVCPAVGTFRAPATRRHIEALLDRWSTEVEAYYNRDAVRFGLPVRYDFHFALAGTDDARSRRRVDVELPLWPTCGRTPYFAALRSGWSVPIVAHEMGHFLGLLDEYEALSGIVDAYPKTPFPGAEVSRMGLSMKEDTLVLPLHHYLVVRRYLCPEPAPGDRFEHVLAP